MALQTLLIVLFALVAAAYCLPSINITRLPNQIQFNSLLVSQCTKSMYDESPECTFNWHNASIWVGGIVPGVDDGILIDAPDKVFTLACDGHCAGDEVNTTTKTLTIKMSENATLVFDTWFATNLNFIMGGSLTITDLVVYSTKLSAYLSLKQTGGLIDSLETGSFVANLTTIEITSFEADYVNLYGTILNVTDEFLVGTIWSAIDSELYLLGTCESPEFRGNGQTFQNTYMYSTTDCQYPLSQDALFINTNWELEATADSPKIYLLPEWITIRLTENSRIYLDGPVELRINTSISSSDSSLVYGIKPTSLVVLLENGHLSGRSSYPRLNALGGVIEANDDHFYVLGELHAGPKSTIYIKDDGYLYAYSIVLDKPALNYSSAGVRNFIKFEDDELNGSFGSINMNYLPYVLDYNNKKGYIAAVLPSGPVAQPVSSPFTEPPVTQPVAAPQGQAPVTNTPVVESPQGSEPQDQPVAVSSPSGSSLAPTAVTDNSNERTVIIALAIGLVAAVIGMIVLGALYHKAKRQGYQVINDGEHRH